MIHMRKKCVIACLFALALMLLTSIAFADTGVVTASSLYLRESATSSSKALKLLRNGAKVDIIGKTGHWYKVTYGKLTGYVYDQYISVTEDKDDDALQKGSKGSEVKKLQQRLTELGYYKSACDGDYGNVTVDAVKAFQKKNGLTADGIADEATLKKLNSSSAVAAKGTTASKTEDDETLKKGSKGSEVKKLQQRLKELGYYSSTCDGDYGNNTVNAVKAFQKKNGLTANGIADEATLKKLNSSSAKPAKEETEVETDETLKKGSKGSAVKKLQERLKELGYYSNSCDGSYGDKTVSAVRAFQQKNGLTVNGIANAATLKKLNSSSAKPAKEESEAEDNETLKQGSKGAAVKKLQERLKELGYYSSTCDGSYGSKTVAAVKAFQKKNSLNQNGIANEATLKKLYASSAKPAKDEVKEENKQDTTLKLGAKGDAVKKVQQRLKTLGYYTYNCDGDYGYRTANSVKAFQQKNGLTADGVANGATLKKLNSSSAIGANDKDASNEKEEIKNDGTLKKGSSGSEVKKLQQRLKDLGFYSSSCDGNYGDKTVTAVKAFQKKNGLTQNGEANATTLKKLNSTSAVNVNGLACVILNTSQTLKKGDSGEQVRALQAQLKKLGYYTNTLDGNYGYQTANAVSAFQRGNKLTVNGTANATTLRKLMSSSAVTKAQADKNAQEEANKKEESKTYVTEKLDWFKKGQSTFPRNAIIEVKDVRTGLVFKAKVLYGTNHLDAEPLTKADTAILLKINGGVDFSWRRRPMLVKYNGHVYASSIYSEPHGDQSITDNNFDGQFCLHFYGSMTHGTEEVKQDHQDCVAQAMKATW